MEYFFHFSSNPFIELQNFIFKEKLKTFCKSEINEQIKLDLIVYKYQLDSSKIENELR